MCDLHVRLEMRPKPIRLCFIKKKLSTQYTTYYMYHLICYFHNTQFYSLFTFKCSYIYICDTAPDRALFFLVYFVRLVVHDVFLVQLGFGHNVS
jgi:hypothetical protein